jgi:hypothetical protein
MFLTNMIMALLMALPFGQEAANIRVKITLFEVPFRIVSWTYAGVTKDGGVAGTTVGGPTTGAFPSGGVSLQNKMSADSSSLDIKSAIQEHMAYSCLRAQDITVNEIARHDLVFDDQGGAGQQVTEELYRDRPSPFFYRLDIEPAWKNDEEIGLALKLWIRGQEPYELQDITGQLPERLVLDQTVAVRFGQMSFTGFPSTTSGPRSIYWLAVSAETISFK